jgi:hypothetical protein
MSGMAARVNDRVEVYGMPVTCRCGCGSTIASTRTFLNKDHQVTWLRSEAARRRQAKGHAAAPDAAAAPEAVPAPPPPAAPPSVLDGRAVPPRPELDLRLLDPEPRPKPAVGPAPPTAVATAAAEMMRPVATTLDVPVGGPEPVSVSLVAPTAEAAAAVEPAPEPESLSLLGEIYVVGSVVAALPVFFGVWLFCLAAFGLPLGGGLGWLPALLVAAVAGAVWPLLIVAGIALLVLML